MADFCMQCCRDVLGLGGPEFPDGYSDFEGITTEEAWAEGRAACVLCEGCGPIQVDPQGRCVSHCMRDHVVDDE